MCWFTVCRTQTYISNIENVYAAYMLHMQAGRVNGNPHGTKGYACISYLYNHGAECWTQE